MRRLRRLAAAAAVGLAALLALELLARAAEPGPFSLVDRRPYVDHATLGHAHRPGFEGRWDGTWYALDSRGFRGPELPATKGADELRVVCLGDSCTFGKGVVEADTWPRRLERALRERGADAVVANLGVNGYDVPRYREAFLAHGAALDPDVVVVACNQNDLPSAVRTAHHDLRAGRDRVPRALRDAAGRSGLYRWLRATWSERAREEAFDRAAAAAATAGAEPAHAVAWGEVEEVLAAIRDAAGGARLVVLLFPFEVELHRDGLGRANAERFAALCAELDVEFVALDEPLRAAVAAEPERRLYLRGDRHHPNAAGYGVVAERVAARLTAD